jgi:hypothetical protein
MPKKPFVFFKNYDYVNDPSGPGKGLYQDMTKYKSVSDFRKKKRKQQKRRQSMLNILLQTSDKLEQ